jgi:hypothetical protein
MKPPISPLIRTLQAGSVLIFLLIFSVSVFSGDTQGSTLDNSIKLNPDCKIKRLSNGTVIVSSKNQEGVEEKHQFNDFYADLLMAAYRKQHTDFILATFSKKYDLSRDECRREIKHALNVLAEWNIVERDDRMASR